VYDDVVELGQTFGTDLRESLGDDLAFGSSNLDRVAFDEVAFRVHDPDTQQAPSVIFECLERSLVDGEQSTTCVPIAARRADAVSCQNRSWD